MVKIEAIQKIKQGSPSSIKISLFSRGSDIITLKLFNRIVGDPIKLWHITDFHKGIGRERSGCQAQNIPPIL